MTSTTRVETRTVVTRPAGDIDPKIAGVFAVAGATIAIVAAAVAATILLGGTVDVPAIIGPVIPVLVAAGVGYVRRSTHSALVEDGVELAAELVDAAAPVLEHTAPELTPVVRQVQDGVATITSALDDLEPSDLGSASPSIPPSP